MKKNNIEPIKHTYIIQDTTGDLDVVKTFQAYPEDVDKYDANCKNFSPLNLGFFAGFVIAIFCVVWMMLLAINLKHDLIQANQQLVELKEQIETDEREMDIMQLIGEYSTTKDKSEPSKNDIYNLAVRCGAFYPEVIVAQAILESNCGNSNIGKKANNLYGMIRLPNESRRRKNTQIPDQDVSGYGVYRNWQMSTIDRVLWDLSVIKNKPQTREEYIRLVSDVYCEDYQNYSKKLNSISEDFVRKSQV